MVIKLEGWGPENNVMIKIPYTWTGEYCHGFQDSMLGFWVSIAGFDDTSALWACHVPLWWCWVLCERDIVWHTSRPRTHLALCHHHRCHMPPPPEAITEWKPVILCHWTNISRFHHPDTNDSKTEINLLVSYSALASWHHEASNCAWSPYQELSYCAVSPTYLTPHTSHQIYRIFPSIRLNFYGRILVIHENPNTMNTQW